MKSSYIMQAMRKILLIGGAVIAGVFFVIGESAAEQPKQLNIYIWSQYISPKIIKQFEKKYQVHVTISNYNSDPELFAKLRAGGTSEYDIVVPGDYNTPKMIKTGLLQPLNKKLIPNLDNLMAEFKNPPYDPHDKYTVPYQWGTTGIAYNTKKLPNAPDSWAILFDPKVNPKYPFVLDNTSRLELGAACAYLGYDFSCIGINKWKKAAKLIQKTRDRSNFNGFMPDTRALKALERGQIVAAVVYSGDFISNKRGNAKASDSKQYANIKFVLPKEGTQIWTDCLAIPSHAPHPKLANKFINFILEPKIGAELSNYNSYATPNKASVPYLDNVLQKPPILPTEAQIKRLQVIPSLSGKQLQIVQQLWTSILAQ